MFYFFIGYQLLFFCAVDSIGMKYLLSLLGDLTLTTVYIPVIFYLQYWLYFCVCSVQHRSIPYCDIPCYSVLFGPHIFHRGVGGFEFSPTSPPPSQSLPFTMESTAYSTTADRSVLHAMCSMSVLVSVTDISQFIRPYAVQQKNSSRRSFAFFPAITRSFKAKFYPLILSSCAHTTVLSIA